MMHFIDAATDGPLLAELREECVLAPDVVARIDALMGRPESGSLNDFLLAGAEVIPEKAWLSWLVRRHGCHRFGRVVWRDEAADWARAGFPPEGNLPFRRCGSGAILLAVLRPDRLQAAGERFGPGALHRAAATLREMRELKSAWERQSRDYTP